jgi:capsular exopolysaccharide synthesis family protein
MIRSHGISRDELSSDELGPEMISGTDNKQSSTATASDETTLPGPANGSPVELRVSSKYPSLLDGTQWQAAEHFAIIRTRILAARAKSGITSILISSPQPREGKTFTALNLAISLAQLEKDKILLVDGDLRTKGVTALLGLEDSVGLADFLGSRVSFADSIRAMSLPQLFVSPAGGVSPSSLPGILEGTQWPRFLHLASRHFGVVIVDSVPVTAPIADFELLSAACDANLLVVQLRKTTREALEIAAQKLNGKQLGVIVNDAERNGESDYYSSYGRKKKTGGPV